LIDEVDLIQQKKALLQQQLQVATKERDAIAPWGDFDPQILKKYQIAAIRFIFLLFRVLNIILNGSRNSMQIVIKQEASKTYFCCSYQE